MAAVTMKQVVEAIGAPEYAANWAGNLTRWRNAYACKRADIALDLKDGTYARKRRVLGMPKVGCEDWAGLLWTENVTISAGEGTPEQEVLDAVFGEDFGPIFTNDIERTMASGTAALEVLIDGIPLNDAGEIVGEATALEIAYVPAECLVPLKWKRGHITELAIVSWCSDTAVEVREHRGDATLRTITNRRFELKDGKLHEVALLPGVVPQLVLRDDPWPLFRCFRPAIANNIAPNSPFGISVFANALDESEAADIAFDNFVQDFELGGKIVFLPESMMRRSSVIDPVTNKYKLIPPQAEKRNLFVAIEDGGLKEQGITEHNPDLRVDDNKLGIETALSMFSSKIGMGDARYQATSAGVKTATEVVSENSDLFRNRRKHLNAVTSAVTSIAHAVLWCADNLLGQSVDPSVEITITADDSVIEDDGARQARGMAKVSAGVLSERSYLINYEGMTEEDADAEVARIKSTRTAPAFFGA